MAKIDPEKVKYFKAQRENAVAILNDINNADPTVLPALIGHRVTCNKALASHPTVQVGFIAEDNYEVGLLGILNGLFGIKADRYGFIAAKFDKNDLTRIEEFVLLEDSA